MSQRCFGAVQFSIMSHLGQLEQKRLEAALDGQRRGGPQAQIKQQALQHSGVEALAGPHRPEQRLHGV